MREVVASVSAALGEDLDAEVVSRRPGDPPRLVASAAKAIRELGWQPQFLKLEDIVATAWQWHQQHPNGYPD